MSTEQLIDFVERHIAYGGSIVNVIENPPGWRLFDRLCPVDAHHRIDRREHILGINRALEVPIRSNDSVCNIVGHSDNFSSRNSSARKQSCVRPTMVTPASSGI